MPSSSMVVLGCNGCCNGCSCPTAPSRGHKSSTVSCKHTTTITEPSGRTVRFQDEVVHHTSGSSSNRLTDSYRDGISGKMVRCYSDDDSDDYSDDDISRRRRQRRLEGGSTSTRHTSSHRPTESRSHRSHTTSSRLTAIPESRMLESSGRSTDGYGRTGATDHRSARPSESRSVRPSESRSHRSSTMGESSRRSTNAHPSIIESRSGSSRVGGEVVVYDDERKGKSSRRESSGVKGLFSSRR